MSKLDSGELPVLNNDRSRAVCTRYYGINDQQINILILHMLAPSLEPIITQRSPSISTAFYFSDAGNVQARIAGTCLLYASAHAGMNPVLVGVQ